MRGSLTFLVAFIVVAGCLERGPSSTPPGSTTPTARHAVPNAPPEPKIVLRNATGALTMTHYVGENITVSSDGTLDPDGRIVKLRWRLMGDAASQPVDLETEGASWTFQVAAPGDRLLFLYADDDGGATAYASAFLAVHERHVATGRLASGLPEAPVPGVTMMNFSLPARSGLLLVSTNASFVEGPLVRFRVDIRAPNGTLVNRTEGGDAPMWGLAMPAAQPGNYTAQIYLLRGPPTMFRFEFTAWYGMRD